MTFADPEHNIEQFVLKEGDKVADLGAGSGFYTLAAAKAVGPKGRVYAVDLHKELLDKVKSEARQKGFNNVEIIWGDIEKIGGTKIADGSLDAGIISNVLFQTLEKEAVAEEVGRIIKKGGRIMVIDWTDSFGGMGPRPEKIFLEISARELFEKYGFKFHKKISAGDHHYGIIMEHV